MYRHQKVAIAAALAAASFTITLPAQAAVFHADPRSEICGPGTWATVQSVTITNYYHTHRAVGLLWKSGRTYCASTYNVSGGGQRMRVDIGDRAGRHLVDSGYYTTYAGPVKLTMTSPSEFPHVDWQIS